MSWWKPWAAICCAALTGCDKPSATSGGSSSATSGDAGKLKIGFIYVGPAADYGYNMSMDLGRLHVEKELGVETTAFEAIPETAEVER